MARFRSSRSFSRRRRTFSRGRRSGRRYGSYKISRGGIRL
jgi:hypothetical protein